MKTLIFTITLIISILRANPCFLELGDKKVDLNPLKQNVDFIIQADGFYDIIINFCTTISNPVTCNGDKGKTAYHVLWSNHDECNWIGGDYNSKNVEVSLINPNQPNEGVFLHYKNGQRFNQGGGAYESETKIRIKCDKDTELSPIVFESNNINGDRVTYLLTASSRHACLKENKECVLKQNGLRVNLNRLTLPRDLSIQADGFYNIKLNFCKPVLSPEKCSGAKDKMAHRVHWQNHDDCNWIGGDLEDTEVSFINQNDPKLGVVLSYKNGQKFYQGGQFLGSETRIGIFCDENTELSRVTYHGTFRENDNLVYSFRTSSKHACPSNNICELNESGYKVNLNPLKATRDFVIQADGFYDVVLNFCTPATFPRICNNQPGKMAHHVHWQNSEECNWIGGDPLDVEIKLMNPPEKGVVVFYKKGSRFNQNGGYLGSETRINLNCDKSQELSPLLFKSNKVEGDKTVWVFEANSKHACLIRV